MKKHIRKLGLIGALVGTLVMNGCGNKSDFLEGDKHGYVRNSAQIGMDNFGENEKVIIQESVGNPSKRIEMVNEDGLGFPEQMRAYGLSSGDPLWKYFDAKKFGDIYQKAMIGRDIPYSGGKYSL